MKTAQDYNVSFSYGAMDGVYYGKGGSAGPYHRGNDRPTLTGVPIVIEGVTIGTTGATGMVSGPHLHTQAWTGTPTNDREPMPYEFKSGTVVAAGTASQWGKHVTIDVKGVNLTYAHLNTINVKVGQVIKPKEDSVQKLTNKNHLTVLFKQFLNRSPTAAEYKDYLNRGTLDYALNKLHPARKDLGSVVKQLEAVTKERDALKKNTVTPSSPATLEAASNWNKLKNLLKF